MKIFYMMVTAFFLLSNCKKAEPTKTNSRQTPPPVCLTENCDVIKQKEEPVPDPGPVPGGNITETKTILCPEGQVLENNSCQNTNEYCALKNGMILGEDGNCQATLIYCKSIDLGFDDNNKICIRTESMTNNSNNKKSLAGFIQYFHDFEGAEFQLSLNKTPLTVAAGATDFLFEDALNIDEDFEVTVIEPAACTVVNGKGIVSNVDVSGIKVHCSDQFKNVHLEVTGIDDNLSFTLQNHTPVAYTSNNNEPLILGKVVAGAPVVITPDISEAITCDISRSDENEDTYTYTAACQNTNNLRVFARVEQLSGANFALILNNTIALFPDKSGDHMFETILAPGEAYSVAIQTQPADQTCSIATPAGNLADKNVVVTITCTNNPPVQEQEPEIAFQRSQITNVSRRNSGGASVIALGSDSKRICLFTKVEFEDLDGGNEVGICSIDRTNGVITLRSELKDSDDADSVCGAHCLSWNTGSFKTYTAVAFRDRTEGASKEDLVSIKDNVFCGLSNVEFKEIDGGGERAECRIIKEDNKFRVMSKLHKSSDISARCAGTCLEFPQDAKLQVKDEKYVQKNNSKGTASTPLAEANNNFCFLKEVSFEDIDTRGEPASCHVVEKDGFWVLEAFLGETDDADAWCHAQCVSW